MPRLENWMVQDHGETVDGKQRATISGDVMDDEKGRFPEGYPIITSLIKEINIEEGYALTMNTRYELGKIAWHYGRFLTENKINLSDVEYSIESRG